MSINDDTEDVVIALRNAPKEAFQFRIVGVPDTQVGFRYCVFKPFQGDLALGHSLNSLFGELHPTVLSSFILPQPHGLYQRAPCILRRPVAPRLGRRS